MNPELYPNLLLAITIARCTPTLTCFIFLILAIVPFACAQCFKNPNIKTGSKINKSIKIIIICYLSFDLVASLCFAITAVADNYKLWDSNALFPTWFDILTFIPHSLGHVSFFLVLMERLYTVFKDTIYEYSNCTFIWILIGATIIEIWHFCIHTAFLGLYDFSDDMALIFISIFIGLNCLFGLILIYLFIRNLMSLVVNQRQSIDISILKRKSRNSIDNMRNKEFESNLDYRRLNMINMITKNCILCIAAVILRNIGVYCFSLTHGHDDKNGISYIVFIYLIIYNITLIFELLCLYMTFSFVEHWYQKICGKMHKCVFRYCKYYAQQKSLQADYRDVKDYQLFNDPHREPSINKTLNM